jgi:hypothetical protein
MGYGINNVGYYSMVYVVEIDKVLEQTAPVTARKLLKFVNTLEAADTTPGSFYEPVTVDVNPKKIYIHTSDGNSPNNSVRYRYEVTVRDRAINNTFQENNHFERLWVRGYGAGNGMIAAGANTTFNRMIIGPGAGIHHLGLRGAVINNSLFLPAAQNTNEFAVVFYDAEGHRRHNKISNSIFLNIGYPLYTHTSYGSDFGALELDNVIGFADSSDAGYFLASSNTDTVTINNVYIDGYKSAYYFGWEKRLAIKNCTFIDVDEGIRIGNGNVAATIQNTYIRVNGNNNAFGISVSDSTNLTLSNSIIHFKNHQSVTPGRQLLGAFQYGYANGGRTHINATGNIFICDVLPVNAVIGATSCINSLGTINDRWQNNVFILLSGNSITWRTIDSGRAESLTYQQWRMKTGQDINSLFLDLRADPRGLKAVFVDPDNGGYTLANTFEGNQIRSMRAGMTSPVSCFLTKPTYEEAAKIIMSNGVLSANACRKPCVQNNIRVSYQFNAISGAAKKVQLYWNLEDERGLDHYEIVRSFGNNDFANIAYVAASGLPGYSFTDSNVMPGITYRYSLVAVTGLLEKCYSEVRSIKLADGKSVTLYPNPSAGVIKLAMNSYTGPVKISITNLMGIKVYSRELNSFYGIPLELDLSGRAKGFYWMRVQTDKDNHIQSFILR